jgi:hypothetical protein
MSCGYSPGLSWGYKPLSYIYFIYKHGWTSDWLPVTSEAKDHVIAKICYLKHL